MRYMIVHVLKEIRDGGREGGMEEGRDRGMEGQRNGGRGDDKRGDGFRLAANVPSLCFLSLHFLIQVSVL